MSPLHAVLGYLVLQRLAELAVARRHDRLLKEDGGIEFGGGVDYVLMVAFHVGWLLALPVMIDPQTPVSVPLLAFFMLLQVPRAWVMWTLGRLWTTRVIVIPGGQRVRSGPYRYTRHPNYLTVLLEILVVPLMFGAWRLALLAGVLKLLVLRQRIRIENKALADVYGE